MGGVRAFFFTFLMAGLAGLFIWVMINSPPSDRLEPLAGALFFGGGLFVPLSLLFAAPIPPPDQFGAIEIRNSPFRCLAMALALLMVVAASIIFIYAIGNGGTWKKYAFYVLPLPCLWLAGMYARWAFSQEPAYRFDPEGLTRFQWGKRRIAWRDVADIRQWSNRGAKNILLDLTPEKRRQRPLWGRFTASLGGGDLSITSMPAGVRIDDLEAIVREYWQRGKI